MTKNSKIAIGVVLGLIVVGVVVYKLIRNKVTSLVDALKWSKKNNFFTLSNGTNLIPLAKDGGITLKRNKGLNDSFSESKYQSAKNNPKVYWAIYDITNDRLLASSKNSSTNVYGASVPKVVVAASALDNNNGVVSDSDYEKIIKLLVKSNNEVWTPIQNLAGGGEAVNKWSKKMGYTMKSARGMGNNANALDMCKFWKDVCRNNFKGAETIFTISSSCQTNRSRGLKYMPSNVYLGNKTGTYNNSNHDTGWVQKGDHFYSISVLTELGSGGSDVIGQMWAGLFKEYT